MSRYSGLLAFTKKILYCSKKPTNLQWFSVAWTLIYHDLRHHWSKCCGLIRRIFPELFVCLPAGQPSSRCEKQRQFALQKHVVGRWIPRCRLDGSYEPIQCDRGWNCWCVDFTGKEIAQSRTRGWPNCGPSGQLTALYSHVSCSGVCRGGHLINAMPGRFNPFTNNFKKYILPTSLRERYR